ncbi:hypothetical protein, partial [Aeromonas hydrophila]|uniref:hypothetical protein n=1 Tax=Aeromonas hydrophila TaxID=644 RepID=UPI001E3D5047
MAAGLRGPGAEGSHCWRGGSGTASGGSVLQVAPGRCVLHALGGHCWRWDLAQCPVLPVQQVAPGCCELVAQVGHCRRW